MSTDYPAAPKPPDADPMLTVSRDLLDQALACLSTDEKTDVVVDAKNLDGSLMTGVKEIWFMAFRDVEAKGTHHLGHAMQAALIGSSVILQEQHGNADMLVYTPLPCDDPQHQLAHNFVLDFSHDVLNGRYEDSMNAWRAFLTDAAEDYAAYVNGVYGVCQVSLNVLRCEPHRREVSGVGTVLQFGVGGTEEE